MPKRLFRVVVMWFQAAIAWPSGLRRCVKAAVRKGVGSNPTAVSVGCIEDCALGCGDAAAAGRHDSVAEWSKALR